MFKKGFKPSAAVSLGKKEAKCAQFLAHPSISFGRKPQNHCGDPHCASIASVLAAWKLVLRKLRDQVQKQFRLTDEDAQRVVGRSALPLFVGMLGPMLHSVPSGLVWHHLIV